MKLNSSNYYSPEQNWRYMSVSQWKDFQSCEAYAMAKLRGEFSPQPSTAMLVGSYVDAFYSGTMDEFQYENPQIFRRDGGLRADYVQADTIITRMQNDKLYSMLMAGRNQVIITGTVAGVEWKGKIDSLLSAEQCQEIVTEFKETGEVLDGADGAIVDQKVMRDTKGGDEPFWKMWGYHYQGAVYQKLEGHNLPFILAIGTKEKPEDLAAIYLDSETLREALYEVEDSMEHVQAVKEGRIAPKRCEHCAYCRMTRKLSTIVNGRAWRREYTDAE